MQTLHYFVNSNSCVGFYSFFRSNFGRIETVIRTQDYPAPLVERLVQEVLTLAEGRKLPVEVVHNCLDNSVEGIILPTYQTAVVNIPAYIDDGYPVTKLMNDPAVEETREHLLRAHDHFQAAKIIHDRWEKIYMEHTDYELLQQYTAALLEKLLEGRTRQGRGSAVHRFFGSATENGAADWIPNLTQDLGKRYLIKGRPGTGKSTFLKKLAEEAQQSGWNTEIYHCAFDPASLDMVVIRELDLCVFDSTAPHEYFPLGERDEILDFYRAAVQEGTDERCQEALERCASDYKNRMAKGKIEIAAANQVRLERETLLWRELNRDKADSVLDSILEKLFYRRPEKQEEKKA